MVLQNCRVQSKEKKGKIVGNGHDIHSMSEISLYVVLLAFKAC